MSRGVHLHPLAVVLAVLAGTTLGGIAGALAPASRSMNTNCQPTSRDRPAGQLTVSHDHVTATGVWHCG